MLVLKIKSSSFNNNVLTHLKKLVEALLHFFLSSSNILVECKTSSASSPRQYSSVLTWRSSASSTTPEAMRNCSKGWPLIGFSEVEGFWQLKMNVCHLKEPLLSPCTIIILLDSYTIISNYIQTTSKQKSAECALSGVCLLQYPIACDTTMCMH